MDCSASDMAARCSGNDSFGAFVGRREEGVDVSWGQ